MLVIFLRQICNAIFGRKLAKAAHTVLGGLFRRRGIEDTATNIIACAEQLDKRYNDCWAFADGSF
jgi:hypothetical protein